MRVIHLTDLHLCPGSHIPQGRTENFHEDVDNELRALAEICVERDVEAVLISGDIFHLKAPSKYNPKDILHYRDLFKNISCPIYSVPGNHDLLSSSMDNVSMSPYLLLVEATPNMYSVHEEVKIIGSVGGKDIEVSGQGYYLLEEAKQRLSGLNERLNANNLSFVLLHMDALREGVKSPPWVQGVTYQELCESLTLANILCLGHIHFSFPLYQSERNQLLSKPFAFGRVIKDYYVKTDDIDKRHVPAYCEIEIQNDLTVNAEYKSVSHRPFEQVFNIEGIRSRVENNVKLKSYFAQLENMGQETDMFNLENPEDWIAKQKIPPEIQEIIDKFLYEKD